MRSGPLTDLKIIEFAGIGPSPFCGMLLSDLGADVLRIDRPGAAEESATQITRRGRRSITLDLKRSIDLNVCVELIRNADGLIEGFRPGVMERLGLGPDRALELNPRLVFGRVTGWGQSGPYAQAAGHDINYIALSGALHAIGTREKPIPPLNLLGDFGGGALYLAFGLLAGIHHSRVTGRGQVVDCAMSDGVSSLMAMIYGLRAAGAWSTERCSNQLDGAAPHYGVYKCRDGRWISLGAVEPQFYAELLDRICADDPAFERRLDRDEWEPLRAKFAELFLKRTRDEWCELLEGSDACFAPVLDLEEAPLHPHNVARSAFVEVAGVVQPAPAPRFSLTPGVIQQAAGSPTAVDAGVLAEWGVSASEIEVFHNDRADRVRREADKQSSAGSN